MNFLNLELDDLRFPINVHTLNFTLNSLVIKNHTDPLVTVKTGMANARRVIRAPLRDRSDASGFWPDGLVVFEKITG